MTEEKTNQPSTPQHAPAGGAQPLPGARPQPGKAPPSPAPRPQPGSPQAPQKTLPQHVGVQKAPASPVVHKEASPVVIQAIKTEASRTRVEEFRKKHRTSLLALLFTDLVGSTQLKQERGDAEAVALMQCHADLVRRTMKSYPEAQEISTAGDSFFCVFTRPSDAVAFALKVHYAMRREFADAARLSLQAKGLTPAQPAAPRRSGAPPGAQGPLLSALAVRIGIHLGEVVVEERKDEKKPVDLFGLQVDTAARVMSLAEGGQTLCTRAVFDNARQVLKGRDIGGLAPLVWLNHGPYVMKGVEEAIEICEVGEKGISPLRPPGMSEKARPAGVSAEELGWRPAPDGKIPGTEWVLEKKLGEGGFGEVWLGAHVRTKEKRVFKFCFLRERAKMLKRELALFRVIREQFGDTPGMVRLFEVYFEQPPYYLGIEYVAGRNLREWLSEGKRLKKLSTQAKVDIAIQIAMALDVAHRAGVIHQDIKPQNILVDENAPALRSGAPRVKLADFGVGKVVNQELLGKLGLTGGGMSLLRTGGAGESGTVMYMAPERVEGRGATTQSDVYSLGVVLFQMMARDMDRSVTLEWEKEVRDAILRVDLRKVLAGNPEKRLQTAAEFVQRLRAWSQRRRARIRRRVGVFFFLMILAAAAYLFYYCKTHRRQVLLYFPESWRKHIEKALSYP